MRLAQQPDAWRLCYERFLASSAWTAKRALVFQRANHVCESCLTARATQVHHVVYPQPLTMATLTTQPAWQLRAVCAACHTQLHADRPANGRAFG